MCSSQSKGAMERPPPDSDDAASELSSSSSFGSACVTASPSSPHQASKARRQHEEGGDDDAGSGPGPAIVLTWRWLPLVLLLGAAVAFSAGAASRAMLLSRSRNGRSGGVPEVASAAHEADGRIPLPGTVHSDRRDGLDVHGSASDDAPAAAAHSDGAFSAQDEKVDFQESGDDSSDDGDDIGDDSNEDSSDDSSDDPDDQVNNEDPDRIPAGEHLFVDIKHVDPIFLGSEPRLAQALVHLIDESDLTLLSYHCHSLVPEGGVGGVSCAGALRGNGHVAFHTWPSRGAIVLDLFSCGDVALLPLLRKLFAVPSPDASEDGTMPPEPFFNWSQRQRGFREGFSPSYRPFEDPLEEDLGKLVGAHDLEMKVELVSEETAFQRVDVWEYIDPRWFTLAQYERSVSGDGSYEAQNPELYKPEKLLYLDGIEQSSLDGDAAYHETLVHPAMMAHPHPRRVAIVGGGEGATLREVLKHNTVEEAVMVEIDGDLVDICREHLPEWSDCRDNSGSDADSCFDDARATVVFEDAFRWFEDAFGDHRGGEEKEKFDVIIMDALDPERTVAIVSNLYKGSFVEALYNGLSEEGVFVVQMGQTASIDDPPEAWTSDRANMIQALEAVGFTSMHRYDDGHSSFGATWNFLVCLKDETSRALWYRPAAETDLQLRRRMHPTRSGRPPLRYFDASTMAHFQLFSRAQEDTHCRSEDAPWECGWYSGGIDPRWHEVPLVDLEVRRSSLGGDYAGRGLFAARDVPDGSTFDMGLAVRAFHVLPSAYSVARAVHERTGRDGFAAKQISAVLAFTEGYGYGATLLGRLHYTVDAGIITFCNHGCNGAYNYGTDDGVFTEANVPLDRAPDELLNKATRAYNPAVERHLRQGLVTGDYALRTIKKGDEILCNYLHFAGNQDDWKSDVMSLRGQCAGETIGQIADYELKAANDHKGDNA